jgi:DNA-binding NarL/FixJ family response regulator
MKAIFSFSIAIGSFEAWELDVSERTVKTNIKKNFMKTPVRRSTLSLAEKRLEAQMRLNS